MNLNEIIMFQDDPIQGATAKDVLYQYLSQYGGFRENKEAIIGILGDLKRDKELDEKDMQILQQAWKQVCNDDNFNVPLMYDKGISDLLEERLGDNDADG